MLKDRLVLAVQAAYRKHVLGDPVIGWEELEDLLADTLCETMGDEQFQEWIREQSCRKQA